MILNGMKKFVIMADGTGERWENYMGIPKHLVEINGEPVIARTVRLLNEMMPGECEVIVTSHDKRYEFAGSRRHEPLNNNLEIDRFTEELIEDNMCFLYGDTYYTEEALRQILDIENDDVLFFGNEKSIVAINVRNSKMFDEHVANVRQLFIDGKIERCVGWQVYQSITGQDFNKKAVMGDRFIVLDDRTTDINTSEEYNKILLL